MSDAGTVFCLGLVPKESLARTSEVAHFKIAGLSDGMLGDETEENDGDPLEKEGSKNWVRISMAEKRGLSSFFGGRYVTLEGRSLLYKKSHEEPCTQRPFLFKKGQGVRCLVTDCLKLLGGLLPGNVSFAQSFFGVL